jgi:1,4-alpha-glucan branching enzyme
MGGEFAQEREWNHDRGLDWDVLGDPRHRGVQTLIRDLNAVYRSTPALYERDQDGGAFELLHSHADDDVIAFARHGRDGDLVVAICNFSPVARETYRIGVPRAGRYVEVLSTDDERYGGSGVTNTPRPSEPVPVGTRQHSIAFRLPPLATTLFRLTP